MSYLIGEKEVGGNLGRWKILVGVRFHLGRNFVILNRFLLKNQKKVGRKFGRLKKLVGGNFSHLAKILVTFHLLLFHR